MHAPTSRRRSFAAVLTLAAACLVAWACSSDRATSPLVPPPPPPPPPQLLPPDTLTLTLGSTVGASTFAQGDTPAGGSGATIDGVACDNSTPTYHIHAHVSLYVNGHLQAIPLAIGVVNPQVALGFVWNGTCWYWLHTHDATGMVHIEPPNSMSMTLGQFFDIWGEPLSATVSGADMTGTVATFNGPLHVWVNGTAFTGDPRTIAFTAHEEITLEIGSPLKAPPVVNFPSGF